MLSCFTVHYLSNKKEPAAINVLAHSECHAVQLLWRYGKIKHPDDFHTRYFFDCRVSGCFVECLPYISPSYIKGLEKGLPGY